MRQTIIRLFTITLLGGTIAFGSSCKKKNDDTNSSDTPDNTEIVGCMNVNAYNYNTESH